MIKMVKIRAKKRKKPVFDKKKAKKRDFSRKKLDKSRFALYVIKSSKREGIFVPVYRRCRAPETVRCSPGSLKMLEMKPGNSVS